MTYRQSWSARIQLEAACYASSVFFTLTYSPESLPDPPQLQPKDLQNFLKRLRRRLEPRRVRFFACGEYGSRSLRPHYHGVLFGLELNDEIERIVNESWNFVDRESGVRVNQGFTKVDALTPARAAYVAKYVCKDVSDDEKIPQGWQKEFARMSLKNGGIGYQYVEKMAGAINKANVRQRKEGFPLLTELLGGSMRIGPCFYPVARYLREKLKLKVVDGHSSELKKALEAQRRWRERLSEDISNGLDKGRQDRLRRQARKRLKKSSGVL